jgi:hypothetical protein
MRWVIVVLVLACKGGTKAEPPPTGSASARVAAVDATSFDAPAPDAFVVEPVSDEEKARINALFESLKAGTKPPGVDVGTFAEEYENYFIDSETAYIAKEPTQPGHRVIEIWPFFHAVGGGRYTQDTVLVMTFDGTGQLVGLRD